MKTTVSALVIGLTLSVGSVLALAQDGKTTAKPAAKADGSKTKTSYAIGVQYGKQFKSNIIDRLELDGDSFIKGLTDSLKGGKLDLSEQECATVIQSFQKELQKKETAKMAATAAPEIKAAAEKNVKEGEAYLAKNKEKAGVKTTESGLQYEVIKEGNGPSPKSTDVVKVHYEGTLINGKVFDSSLKRGEPTTFPLNRVIPGWTEGLQLMKKGAKYRFVIPSDLAYGFDGQGPDIGPNSVLIFTVELLEIQ